MVLRMREPVNAATHAVGAALSVLGLVLLIARSADPAKVRHIVTFAVFGMSLIALYLCSTLYHWLNVGPDWIRRLRKLDHSMIFVLIAATYTPICLIALRGGWGWSIFGVVWGLAVLGTGFKLFWMGAPRVLSTGLYLAMGWVVLVAMKPLIEAMPVGALVWLAAGGLFYTIGAIIYGIKKPNLSKGLGFHEIFHLFCILGSFSHFWVMYRYVAEMA